MNKVLTMTFESIIDQGVSSLCEEETLSLAMSLRLNDQIPEARQLLLNLINTTTNPRAVVYHDYAACLTHNLSLETKNKQNSIRHYRQLYLQSRQYYKKALKESLNDRETRMTSALGIMESSLIIDCYAANHYAFEFENKLDFEDSHLLLMSTIRMLSRTVLKLPQIGTDVNRLRSAISISGRIWCVAELKHFVNSFPDPYVKQHLRKIFNQFVEHFNSTPIGLDTNL